MGFRMTQEQRDLQLMVRNFMEKEVKPVIGGFDERSECPIDLVRESMDLGFHQIIFPEEYGGLGMGLRSWLIAMTEMCKVDSGFGTMLNPLGLEVVMLAGNEEQKRRASEILLKNNGISAFCLTEPNAGSDSSGQQTTAVRDGDNYIINGSKIFITAGAYADLFIVIAVTDKSKGPKGISAFMVEKGTPGLVIGKEEHKIGLRTSNTVELSFQDMVVSKKNLLGEEGLGFITAMKGLDFGRLSVACMGLGISERCLEECVAYANQRKCFGQTIGNFQSIQFMLADMAKKIEASRQLIDYAITLYEEGKPYGVAASYAKCFATDSAMEIATDAVQIFGGYGTSTEYPIEKLMRDAKLAQIVEGTNQIQRQIIGKSLLKGFSMDDYILID